MEFHSSMFVLVSCSQRWIILKTSFFSEASIFKRITSSFKQNTNYAFIYFSHLLMQFCEGSSILKKSNITSQCRKNLVLNIHYSFDCERGWKAGYPLRPSHHMWIVSRVVPPYIVLQFVFLSNSSTISNQAIGTQYYVIHQTIC